MVTGSFFVRVGCVSTSIVESIVNQGNTLYPVVDVFAGPGGLGEGFASFLNEEGKAPFVDAASIEQSSYPSKTLLLRHFLRSFPRGEFPEEYIQYMKSEIPLVDLFGKYPKHKASADRTVLRLSLSPNSHELVRGIIGARLRYKTKWVLVGGPPCQAYSLVGRSRMKGDPEFQNDIRHFLYREYLQIIVDHAPPIFVMENVKGLLSAKVEGKLVIERMLKDLKKPGLALGRIGDDLGYKLHSLTEKTTVERNIDPRSFLVRTEEFGIPQARHRVFIIGVRNDISINPGKLIPQKSPTLKQTISDLPRVRSGLSKSFDSLSTWRDTVEALDLATIRKQLNSGNSMENVIARLNAIVDGCTVRLKRQSKEYPLNPCSSQSASLFVHRTNLGVLNGHETRGHMPSDLHRYAFASAFAIVTGRSPKLVDFPECLVPNHKNVALGQKGKAFADRFRVQLPDRPATTITSHISRDGHYFIHYDPVQCRSLTVREVARIQTFPDDFKFEGPRTAQYHQIGNAVPPYLAMQIAQIVADVLDRADV